MSNWLNTTSKQNLKDGINAHPFFLSTRWGNSRCKTRWGIRLHQACVKLVCRLCLVYGRGFCFCVCPPPRGGIGSGFEKFCLALRCKATAFDWSVEIRKAKQKNIEDFSVLSGYLISHLSLRSLFWILVFLWWPQKRSSKHRKRSEKKEQEVRFVLGSLVYLPSYLRA